MTPLYDFSGQPIVYVDPACQALYDAAGRLLGWFEQEFLYAPNGRYLGWQQQGWLYDRAGYPALFTGNATGGPCRPLVEGEDRPCPCYWLRRATPPRTTTRRRARPARRRRATNWSPLSGLAYFLQ